MSDSPAKRHLLWHSNAPFAPTGYGMQTALVAPFLAERYDLALSAFYGLEGSPMPWKGIPVLPGLGGDFGNSTLPEHAKACFGGDPRNGIIVTLCDVWPLDADMVRKLNVACWCPVDHEPAPPRVTEFLMRSEAIPIAMTRFGQESLGRLEPLYVPHAVDCEIFQPLDKDEARAGSFPDGAFIVGMIAANKGRPSRKGFAQGLFAVRRLMEKHDNVFVYLHTVLDANIGQGENLPALIKALGIPEDRIRVASQYHLLHDPYKQEDMARIISALDVLLNPSLGEGFGIPVLEAAACGVPAIVTDFTAMREVCQAGWHVKCQPFWTGLGSWQATPDIDDILSALEECYEQKPSARVKLTQAARRNSLQYDIQRVWKQHWLPTLRAIEQRIDSQTPVVIPARMAA